MAISSSKNNVDIEMGVKGSLYPGMQENPQMRWAFIRKIYCILFVQLLITFGVSAAMFTSGFVRHFMRTPEGRYSMLGLMIVTVILCLMMQCFSQRHPWNFIFMLLFTFAMSFMVGAVCTQTAGDIVLLATGLTLLIFFGLTLFTFFAAKKGFDFSFLAPFLFCAMLLLFAFSIIRMLFPFGQVMQQVYGFLGALIFSAYIIYDTDNVIKRFDYDQYIDAAASLYLDIINLFLSLLQILDAGR